MPTLFPAPSGAGLSLVWEVNWGHLAKICGGHGQLGLISGVQRKFPRRPSTHKSRGVRQGLPQLELPSWVHLPLSLETKHWTVLLAEAGDRGMLRHPLSPLREAWDETGLPAPLRLLLDEAWEATLKSEMTQVPDPLHS